MELKLEYRNTFKETNTNFKISNTKIMVTPPINEDYWVFRVRLYKDQSVIAFPKFGLMGIGFAIEEDDWNVNLPSNAKAEEICEHIWDNHKYDEITKEQCTEAIEILRKASKYYMEYEYEPPEDATYDDFVKYEKRLKEFMKIK